MKSAEPLAKKFSDTSLSDEMNAVWLVRVIVHSPVLDSHNLIELSQDPLAITLLETTSSTETVFVCPRRVLAHSPFAIFQIFTDLSALELASLLPLIYLIAKTLSEWPTKVRVH